MIFPYAQIAVEAERLLGRWQREALARVQQRMKEEQHGEAFKETSDAGRGHRQERHP